MINDSAPATDSTLITLATFSLCLASIEFATDIPNPIKQKTPRNAINANTCIIIEKRHTTKYKNNSLVMWTF